MPCVQSQAIGFRFGPGTFNSEIPESDGQVIHIFFCGFLRKFARVLRDFAYHFADDCWRTEFGFPIRIHIGVLYAARIRELYSSTCAGSGSCAISSLLNWAIVGSQDSGITVLL